MKEITGDSFEEEVLNWPSVVLMDFFGDHCPSCRLLSPIVLELAGELGGRVRVLKVDVEQNIDLAKQYAITSLPTVLILRGGEMVVRLVGLQNKTRLLRAIEMAEGKGT